MIWKFIDDHPVDIRSPVLFVNAANDKLIETLPTKIAPQFNMVRE